MVLSAVVESCSAVALSSDAACGDRIQDAADFNFKRLVGIIYGFGTALTARTGFGLFGLEFFPRCGILLEHLDGGRHRANFVAAIRRRDRSLKIAVGQPAHRDRHAA